jgi:hypothetical protein
VHTRYRRAITPDSVAGRLPPNAGSAAGFADPDPAFDHA